MVTKVVKWVPITALLMVLSWRPSASYQIPLDLVVCAGAVMGVLALISSNKESGPTTAQTGPRGAGHCKAVSVAVLGATVRASETPMADTNNTEPG
jgi:hypothetical protein